MIDTRALSQMLRSMGLCNWTDFCTDITKQRLSPEGHGDFAKWQDILMTLAGESADTQTLLRALSPWRKGPLDLGDVHIDSEWRSDLKWDRVRNAIAPLAERNVLDVGCGNGYYALKMADAGARNVIGIDPTVLFVMQFLAINLYAKRDNVVVLPARLEEVPLPARQFDTSFSMGVLYHRRSPIDHLRQLQQTLRSGGQLVLETLFLPGDDAYARTPPDRYARMRNVWHLPTRAELTVWLQRTGYKDINIIDQSITTVEEQRSTDWMPFESLREALDPADPGLTVEGWPAPHRVVVTATAP